MNELDNVLEALKSEISKIKNINEYKFSNDAFEGHEKRYKDNLQLISDSLKKGKILEIGSSPYHLTFALKKLGYDIYGLDVNPKTLKGFQKKNNLRIKRGNIETERLPFPDGRFDMVIFTEIFEHLSINPIFALREVNRVLRRKGLILLSTPNLYSLHKIIMFIIGKSFNNALQEFKKVESAGYMGHIREYSNKEIKDILEFCKFKIKNTYFRKYNNYFLNPSIKKTPLILLGYILEFTTNILWFFRPTQIVIGKKVE